MAGPIKISILADAAKAVKEVTHFSEVVDSETKRVVTSLGDSKLTGGFGKAQEGFDVLDTRAMGFRDTITGVQDTMTGFQALMGQGAHASDTLGDKLLLVGMGVGDLASGFANFLVPMAAMATSLPALTTGFKALNFTMLMNPIFLVVAAIIALVAIFVIAYKKSETFRRIVNSAFSGILAAARAVWNWIRSAWTALWGTLGSAAKRLPGIIAAVFVNANTWLVNAGMNIVRGLWSGISSLAGWIKDRVIGFVANVIPGPVRKALGIASPSKVMKQIGQYTGMGLALGITDQTDAVRRASAGLAAASVTGIGSGTTGGGGGAAGVTISFDAGGDPLMDAILTELRKRIRIQGGNVQAVLGR